MPPMYTGNYCRRQKSQIKPAQDVLKFMTKQFTLNSEGSSRTKYQCRMIVTICKLFYTSLIQMPKSQLSMLEFQI